MGDPGPCRVLFVEKHFKCACCVAACPLDLLDRISRVSDRVIYLILIERAREPKCTGIRRRCAAVWLHREVLLHALERGRGRLYRHSVVRAND